MFHWQVLAFGKVMGSGFMMGKCFAPDAVRAVELSGEPTAVAFPSKEYGFIATGEESFQWLHPVPSK